MQQQELDRQRCRCRRPVRHLGGDQWRLRRRRCSSDHQVGSLSLPGRRTCRTSRSRRQPSPSTVANQPTVTSPTATGVDPTSADPGRRRGQQRRRHPHQAWGALRSHRNQQQPDAGRNWSGRSERPEHEHRHLHRQREWLTRTPVTRSSLSPPTERELATPRCRRSPRNRVRCWA